MWDDYTPFTPDLKVYEEERPETIPTGLLDASGRAICRQAEQRLIGFNLSPVTVTVTEPSVTKSLP